ncbi:MAG: DUF4178 domain-containing protein [Bacillota bacterium]|uniref:DUF4178 domain-containing protein n=1 Tax=Virgibacillus salarius TaxID=447199 RepID=A0A941DQN0_9BACI|nr:MULTISPECIES: DUF4178 domain-containing protein [Bacillaceae]MBR7794755.1 DUF4178 domain-containing protein [Virgibacillus salarius]MDY7046049.1 DUF4178 domain-containing protein [Virgibacillus sp. M23]NAZ07475.1 DUF4178 domain-containing protein [Agaribacter marinus]WBX81008.1 DUF4178 domain-containing protein [Virgibacillus salarius]
MSILGRLFGKKNDTNKPIQERNMFNLEMNDIVTFDLEDYKVVGKISYDDHGFKWHAYQLEGTHKTIWLSVEMDDELNLGMYEKIKLPLQEPIPKQLEYDGTTYYLDESGTARVIGVGRSQNLSGMTCHYFDYYDDDEEKFLSIEKWGNEIEVSTGYEIEEFELKIIASK